MTDFSPQRLYVLLEDMNTVVGPFRDNTFMNLSNALNALNIRKTPGTLLSEVDCYTIIFCMHMQYRGVLPLTAPPVPNPVLPDDTARTRFASALVSSTVNYHDESVMRLSGDRPDLRPYHTFVNNPYPGYFPQGAMIMQNRDAIYFSQSNIAQVQGGGLQPGHILSCPIGFSITMEGQFFPNFLVNAANLQIANTPPGSVFVVNGRNYTDKEPFNLAPGDTVSINPGVAAGVLYINKCLQNIIPNNDPLRIKRLIDRHDDLITELTYFIRTNNQANSVVTRAWRGMVGNRTIYKWIEDGAGNIPQRFEIITAFLCLYKLMSL